MPRTNGSSASRGYGHAHRAERAKWAPKVKRGGVPCARCGQAIEPDEPWDLDHQDDRQGYLGPSHRDCNRADGARKRNAGVRRQERPWTRPSREW